MIETIFMIIIKILAEIILIALMLTVLKLTTDLFKSDRKHAVWVKTNPLTDTFECSLCGMQVPVPEMCSPYCPECGAKMRERGETNE